MGGRRKTSESDELIFFANAIRDCLGLAPLPFSVTPKSRTEEHRFYQQPFAWADHVKPPRRHA